ncbi:hypothetical protein ACMV_P5_00030 (plasmid) [Acidiphilium multivorum AIU301]|uniref:Uncharacterized protein n=1 Tax=Acidiphilium multivorum (strain DSM 11245 / JCM 8867 / NBRC 100883 / AIU 301) TaxID=926570 RepID=F0J840_ACIMA|nr:hypothetical protein [Acidiphilium multivorum]BAJ83257.1 hypothetical protein ACMV_P5_00030 [Acidiphilium multivorum AIU301]GAN72844.1 hypothetical protein Apmu_0033_17 [Acidiphilium multivorum AIU301]
MAKATESKFAGIFQNATPAASPAEPAPERAELPVPSVAVRSLGRPHGKRSDPAWKQFSVLLRRQTQRDAVMILRAGQGENENCDLSDLLQELLEQWVSQQRRS